MLGVTLLPWQRQVAEVALEQDDGRPAFRDVLVATPRQSGKSTLLLALLVWRLLAAEGQRIVYGAQSRLASRQKLIDDWWPMVAKSPVGDMFKLSKAMGMEALRCSNGSLMTLVSTESSSGHGQSLDLAVLDECWSMSAAQEQAVRPAMVTRPGAQLWMTSTAGDVRSVWWRSRVEAARERVEAGSTRGVAYFEWSAGAEVDVTDPVTWASFMPALGHTIDERTVADDAEAMDLNEFRRAYANQWIDELDLAGWELISEADWRRAIGG